MVLIKDKNKSIEFDDYYFFDIYGTFPHKQELIITELNNIYTEV